jgi:hypothetical protein
MTQQNKMTQRLLLVLLPPALMLVLLQLHQGPSSSRHRAWVSGVCQFVAS